MAEERKEGTQCGALTSSGEQCKRLTHDEFCSSHVGLDSRTPREHDSRKVESRPTDSWLPTSQLPVPDPQEGWKFRYIRVSSLDKADVKNASRKLREGWEPVAAKDHPELNFFMNDLDSRWPDGVEIGGLLLCKMPTETIEARKKYYRDHNANQIKSVDQGFMNEQDPRMPKHNESQSRTSFRKG